MTAYTQAAAPLTPDYESPALFDNELGQMRGLAEVWTEQQATHREYVKSYAPLQERRLLWVHAADRLLRLATISVVAESYATNLVDGSTAFSMFCQISLKNCRAAFWSIVVEKILK